MYEPGESLVSEHQFGFLFPLAVLGREPRAPYIPGPHTFRAGALPPRARIFSVLSSFALGRCLTRLLRQVPVLLSIQVTTCGLEQMCMEPRAHHLRPGQVAQGQDWVLSVRKATTPLWAQEWMNIHLLLAPQAYFSSFISPTSLSASTSTSKEAVVFCKASDPDKWPDSWQGRASRVTILLGHTHRAQEAGRKALALWF